jgi:predicted ferric reductase
VHRNVRRNYFNIFYYTHLMYVPITILNLFHGANYFGPNFWKFFIIFVLPTYIVEIVYRFYQGSIDVALVEFTNMDKVTRLALGKESMPVYKEGMFAFINCPEVSEYEWHPFTISSAPQEPYITFHMRIQGKNSWTRGVKDYLDLIAGGKVFTELYHHDPKQGRIRGMRMGPTGRPFFHVRGPCSAPTQHISEYDEVMICASGIGVTPLASCMKSIVFHKWKFFSGRCFPDRAHFFWVCSHRDLASFRWFVRTIKEAEDAVIDLTQKNTDVGTKMFHMHIFVTSFKESNMDMTRPAEDEQSQLSFWGKKRSIDDKADRIVDNVEGGGYNQVTQYGASFTEWDLYA